ncbi:hypothetical protein ACM7M5_21020 [Pseudomonas aeruginosa]|uniref:hypothetical protein n=1 Tax=Pseudomonas aeruginosa TaxID=287 RepID=UPI002A6B7C4B|nr:hypothetical protein [Pseudomonas aeruginosa]MDY1297513.1 hypothetical protein [Pseudomonas aeruginosa]
MAIYEVVSGGDRQSLFKRFMHKSKMQAISELVDIHLLHCRRIEKLEAERDAALARVAELERQEPVALANRGLHAFWVKWTEAAAGLYGPGIKLYAAPVAQAQHSVPEGLALIPVRETEAMHDAVMALLYKGVARTDTQKLLDAYIAAAPGKEVGHE